MSKSTKNARKSGLSAAKKANERLREELAAPRTIAAGEANKLVAEVRAAIRDSKASSSTKKKSQKPVTKQAAKAQKYSKADMALLSYLKGMSNPFDTSLQCHNPSNYNPVPSGNVTSFMTTTIFQVDVVSQTVQLSVGSHGSPFDVTIPGSANLGASHTFIASGSMDAEAYHDLACSTTALTYNAPPYVLGPCTYSNDEHTAPSTAEPICGATNVLPLNTWTTSSSPGGIACVYRPWSVPYPVEGSTMSGHLRSKALSFGIKIINNTAMALRSGNIVTVAPYYFPPSDRSGNTNQSFFVDEPSFQVHSVDGEVCLFVPLDDEAQSFHHPGWTSEGQDSGNDHLVMESPVDIGDMLLFAQRFVWINNPTAESQNYTIEIVAHWEIAGTAVKALAKPVPLFSGTSEKATTVVQAYRNTTPSPGSESKTLLEIGKQVIADTLPSMDAASRFTAGVIKHFV